ncbi:MAG: segregation/condensation protein A [candidate division Zixibacteria bacterium]
MPDTKKNSGFDFVFELEAFDGPLDLLLFLIKRDEVDIYDIPIAEITRQYLAYLDAARELNLEVAGEFLYMASVLIRIKAQMLLPKPEEDEEWEDPRTELVNALMEYKRVKKISESLEYMAESRSMRHHRRDSSLSDLPQPEPELMKVDLAALMIAFGELINRVKPEPAYGVQRQEITVDMRKEYILSLFENRRSVEFEELFLDDPRKIVMVVTFIALLELVKLLSLRVEQAERFSTIRIYRTAGEEIPANLEN